VATYVANASDYKEKYVVAQRSATSARSELDGLRTDLTDAKAKYDEATKKAEGIKPTLEAKIAELTDELTVAKGEIATLNKRVADSTAIVQTANATALKQTELYETAHKQLTATESDKIQLAKEYDETQAVLLEKLAVIASQDKQIRELQEEKSDIQGRLEQYLRQYGKTPAPANAVTMVPSKVQMAQPIKPIGLKGLISDLDVENRLAEISLGSTDGVKEQMKFIVTRDNQFVCNIVVLDVNADRAVGVLDLIKGTPKVGDRVSTN